MEYILSHTVAENIPILWIDVIALIWFWCCWLGYTHFTRMSRGKLVNLHDVMHHVRQHWMKEMLSRDIRNMDAILMGNLLRSISFFASTSIFLLLGLVTILGYKNQAMEILSHIPFANETSAEIWEAKILLLAVIFINAFFKYTWSLRQYNYACILVGAAPPASTKKELLEAYTNHAGELIANAGRHFNMGLRAYYFGLAAIAWFVHPILFMGVSALVVLVLYRREFKSRTADTLRDLYNTCFIEKN